MFCDLSSVFMDYLLQMLQRTCRDICVGSRLLLWGGGIRCEGLLFLLLFLTSAIVILLLTKTH